MNSGLKALSLYGGNGKGNANMNSEIIEGANDLIKLAYNTLQQRTRNSGEKLYVAYSGGKDSECIVQLCLDTVGKDAIEVNYNATGIDPPEVVRHIRQNFRRWEAEGIECVFNKPKARMHDLIVKKGPPTRRSRYCCEYFKENASNGRVAITGVRWAESPRRKESHGKVTRMSKTIALRAVYNNDNDIQRELMEQCTTKSRLTVNPIIDWLDKDVWNYIRHKHIKYSPLYDEGFKRLGCIGCPMAGRKGRQREFARWPHMERYYKKAFAEYLKAHPEVAQRNRWYTVDDMWHWWMEDGVIPGQIEIDYSNLQSMLP